MAFTNYEDVSTKNFTTKLQVEKEYQYLLAYKRKAVVHAYVDAYQIHAYVYTPQMFAENETLFKEVSLIKNL